ncbi:LexA family transcriptional regulator [Hymenobacter sp. BT664]|uniref:LexA family transcriptional regulator n=1 Tax=Hymenobacter montanus TaxID=2771359 RepID=A0A927GKN2_9BACT|nr:LexA family transcriptional regulator [Hymenobacter montanus]MBD2769737.1 LexA family transcriptional regulator [Hymenobacter montanus]
MLIFVPIAGTLSRITGQRLFLSGIKSKCLNQKFSYQEKISFILIMKVGKTINERLAQVRVALGHTPNAFADALGISRGFLDNIEAGRKKLSLELALFLAEKLDVAPDFMLLGRGPIFLTGNKAVAGTEETANLSADISANTSPVSKSKRTKNNQAETELTVHRNPTPPKEDNLRILVVTTDPAGPENISLVGTRVAAGYAQGGFIEREFMRHLPTFSLPDAAYRNGTFRAFQVSGESMQPTLYEGDWVICRYVENWGRDIQDTFVHVVVTDEIPVVKRLLNRLTERGQLTLQSDNPAFAAQFLDGERVREVWRAVGRLSRQFANPRYDLTTEMSRTRADVDDLAQRLAKLEGKLLLQPLEEL